MFPAPPNFFQELPLTAEGQTWYNTLEIKFKPEDTHHDPSRCYVEIQRICRKEDNNNSRKIWNEKRSRLLENLLNPKIIEINSKEKRINLSLKHFSEDPWIHFEEKYHVNDIVKGKVTKLTEFGAFIELEEGIEGLVHISEFSWTKKVSKPADMVNVGDDVECMILGYDIQAGRVSLGLKQVTANPWDTIVEKYPEGARVTGKVVKITQVGAFIQLEDGIDGFLHADDISWTKKVKYPGSELSVNQEVEVVVTECDVENHRVKVGIKQLTDNPWKSFAAEYKAGSTLEGEVSSITEFGVFVKTPSGIEGLVNKANLSEDRDTPFEEAVKKYNVGDKINVYVVDVKPGRQQIKLSIKEFKKKMQRDKTTVTDTVAVFL